MTQKSVQKRVCEISVWNAIMVCASYCVEFWKIYPMYIDASLCVFVFLIKLNFCVESALQFTANRQHLPVAKLLFALL